MPKLTVFVVLVLLFMLPACSGQIAATVETALIADPDPCIPQNLPETVQPTNDLMSEFDRVSRQVASAPADQIPGLIADLQRIRRTAEDLPVPPCLGTLKSYQLNHMNLVIQAWLVLIGGGDQETLQAGFELAREAYQQYSFELIRLLGITLATVTVTP